jgi:hypothetical protein
MQQVSHGDVGAAQHAYHARVAQKTLELAPERCAVHEHIAGIHVFDRERTLQRFLRGVDYLFA